MTFRAFAARSRRPDGWGRAAAALSLIVLAGCGTGPSATGTGPTIATVPAPPVVPASQTAIAPSASRPCGTTPHPGAYQHVVWILMENRALSQVAGSASAPYLNSVARACGLATDYSGVAHPSLPNYIALTSGSTHGIQDDASPGSHHLAGPSIFSLLGAQWRSLEETMPSNCDHGGYGDYAVKHNPAAYYAAIAQACAAQDQPLGAPPDLSARFTLITPNLCHDMHDCSTAAGDAWLAQEMPVILDTPQYRGGRTVVFITWDEGFSSGSNLVPTYVVAPSVRPGTRSSSPYTHYSLLRTTQELLGLSPLLGAAASATSMQAGFNL